jgi:hypothetical protein
MQTNAFVLAILFFLSLIPLNGASTKPDRNFASFQPAEFNLTGPQSRTAQTGETRLYLPLIAKPPVPTSDLADGWYLMVDDGHIASRDVERVYHPFKKYRYNPIMRADKPWEGRVIQLYGTVLPNFRMWYSSYNWESSITRVLYADSIDGLSWNKPSLDANGRNVLFGGQDANMISVINTPQDLERPYKLMAYQRGEFYGHWSLDGIHTQSYADTPLISSASDVAQFYWDPNTLLYRGTIKGNEVVGELPRKIVRLLDSSDFTNWSQRPETLVPDALDDQYPEGLYTHFYGMPVFPIGEQYLGLLWVLKARDQIGWAGPVNVQLVSSHDGVNWIREEGDRPPILDLGPPGSWDDGQIYTATQPLRFGDKLWLYYSGCNLEHGGDLRTIRCSIGLAKADYHRLASLEGTGIVLSEPLTLDGPNLHLNYDGSQGSILVELLKDGETIPGYEAENCLPLSGDEMDQVVAWSGQSSLPEGALQIKFHLQNSALYAFR